MTSLRPLVLGMTGAALLALPAAASGASYSVYACKGPTGAPAPLDGWTPSSGNNSFTADTCAAGGAFSAGLKGLGDWDPGIGAAQTFTAPAGTRITAVGISRRTIGLAAPQTGLGYRLESDAKVIERCDPGLSSCTTDLDGTITLPNLDLRSIRFRLGCFESAPAVCKGNGAEPRVDVSQVALTLTDDTPPVIGNVQGTLATAGAGVKGPLALTFDAADAGGGLYRVITLVDGNLNELRPIAADTCTDAAPGDRDDYQFLAAKPCPTSVNGIAAGVDTTKLSNGAHTVAVFVEDAAGSRTEVLPSRVITVANPVPVVQGASTVVANNGIGADVKGRLVATFDKNGKRTLRNRFGRRVVIRGRLLNSKGRGIQGARIDVYHRLGGKLRLLKTGLKTRKDGKLTLICPLDLTTRDIVLAYRAKRPGSITSQQTLKLTVVSAKGNVIHRRPGKLGRAG